MFELLTPDVIIPLVEETLGIRLDGTVVRYSSYINRVFGLRSDDGAEVVVKFYRPGRWNEKTVEEEHRFLQDCIEEEIPVIAPLSTPDGETLHVLEIEPTDSDVIEFFWAAFPKRGGRNFDAEGDDDWLRLGSIIGRIHAVGASRGAENRVTCTPESLTRLQITELLGSGLVHPEMEREFREIGETFLETVSPLFIGVPRQRIHGDCHRGNILDRGELLLIDFDDMMVGPVVQDFWLLLPDYVDRCKRELTHFLEGYRSFHDFDEAHLTLIEPLRFMRMVHYLHWQARQTNDPGFAEANPGWGEKAFWITEVEDLRDQMRVITGSETPERFQL